METISTPKTLTGAERKLLGANAAIWAAAHVRTESGEPMDFERHRYQLEPMCQSHPKVSVRKGTQGGRRVLSAPVDAADRQESPVDRALSP